MEKKTIAEKIEEELLNNVIRPAITTNSLHYDVLLKELKSFYLRNDGKYGGWLKLLQESI